MSKNLLGFKVKCLNINIFCHRSRDIQKDTKFNGIGQMLYLLPPSYEFLLFS